MADSMGLSFNHFCVPVIGQQNISQSNGYYAVQDHIFKVTDFGTNRKPICDFILVINTNFYPISQTRTIPKLLQIIGQICAFDVNTL